MLLLIQLQQCTFTYGCGLPAPKSGEAMLLLQLLLAQSLVRNQELRAHLRGLQFFIFVFFCVGRLSFAHFFSRGASSEIKDGELIIVNDNDPLNNFEF